MKRFSTIQFTRNLLLALCAVLFACLLSEGLARLVLDPVNYLKPPLRTEPVLGHVIPPHAAGHDALGFRNKDVPQNVSILAIGDSMTYGNQALARDAWPKQLERLTGRSVYNMGLGGYGPVQYYELARRGLERFKPGVVIVCLFLGNDLIDAASQADTPYWRAFLAGGDAQSALAKMPPPQEITNPTMGWAVEFCLRHSILFRLALESPAGALIRRMRTALNGVNMGFVNFAGDDGGHRLITVPAHGEQVALLDGYFLTALDPERPIVRKGLDVTKDMLKRLHGETNAHGCRLVVLLVPTKESVFAAMVLRTHPNGDVARSIVFESKARLALTSFMDEQGIAWVDSLPCLRESLEKELPFPIDTENHPNALGYGAIARCLVPHLDPAVVREGQ